MRVAIATLGCKVNQYDSGVLESRLRAKGCQIVAFAPGADTYVINTCSVTDRADAESRRMARRARRFGPSSRVVMTGCFAQADPKGAAIPEVDFVIGLNRLPDLVAAAAGDLGEEKSRILVDNLRRTNGIGTFGAETFCGQTRAFLKVQEGCDLFCTFCIVPFSRGRSRSLQPRLILQEVERLAALGYREIVLTGVHLGGYGEDLTPRIGLADLVEMIAETSPVQRIRLSSVDPPEITPRLLRAVSRSSVICSHFHIPIQSADNGVLKRMRRRYSVELVREVMDGIRDQLPAAGIGTDVIAGFPGETEEEFGRTEDLVRELPFTYLHVFPYSPRKGTTAVKLPGRVHAAVITERARRLRQLDKSKRREFSQLLVGRRTSVLLENGAATGDGMMAGYTRNYVRVHVPAPRTFGNREVDVRVVAAREDRLVAQLVA